ncbi:MAG: peptide deformylase [Acidimicrobiia bacterium]|jgi:peptide deformylase
MAVFPIRVFGDPVLRTVADPVTEFDDALARLIADLLETMYDAPGVGLAAPQIGVSKRLLVYDIGEGPGHVINPEVVETSGKWEFDEGCLSVPERFWPIERPDFVRVEGVDLAGEPITVTGDELLGRMLQHEVDHLNGKLLIEQLDTELKKEALRELREEALGIAQRD